MWDRSRRFQHLWVMAIAMFLSCATCFASEDGQRYPATEPFSIQVLSGGLEEPWEVLWGPDGNLWITERKGLRITRMNPDSGAKKTMATLSAAHYGLGQDGVLGMAFAPGFLKSADNNFLYVYYTHKAGDSDKLFGRLARYTYDSASDSLINESVLLDGLPAGSDHNAGRLRYGPDGMLYLTVGDMGKNQFASYCLPIEAQRIPTQTEVAENNWIAYQGKSLRIRPDGGIPADNPEINGVRSHVFTYGHRNPQGLCFVGDTLYSVEHGPSTDDELNVLEAGGNYGWPHVAGFRDGLSYAYANYSAAANCQDLAFDPNVIPEGVPVQNEMEWFDANFKPPAMTFFTVPGGHNFSEPLCGPDSSYLCWPTIAPSSVIYYPEDGAIPAWRGSLLITTLKTGAVFRVPLSSDKKQVRGGYEKLFRSNNRYRSSCLDPEGRRLFVACDNKGGATDDMGKPTDSVRDPGAILVFTFDQGK